MWVRVSWFGYGHFFRVDWGGESETLAASTVQFKNDVGKFGCLISEFSYLFFGPCSRWHADGSVTCITWL